MVLRSGCGIPGARTSAGQGDVDSLNRLCGRGCGGRFEGSFDVLLELVEAHAEGLAGLSGGGLEPDIADELEAALLAAEPVQTEGFGVHSGDISGDFGGEAGEGAVKGGVVVVFDGGYCVVHAITRVNDRAHQRPKAAPSALHRS
jgi:hypothetical protein